MRTIVVSAAALVLSGCFAPLDRSRAIEVERHWYGTAYAQGDGQLDHWDMMRALESEDAARPHVERGRRYFYGAMATAVVGGASTGLGLGELDRRGGNRTIGWSLVGVGVVLLVPMEMLSFAQRSAEQDAVTAHNASLQVAAPAPAPHCELRGPWVAALPAGRGGAVHAAGFEGAFW